MNFASFITQLIHNPMLFVITALISGVIFVNGCTDAPNSIVTCVSTRCLSPKKALIMAAICNFSGIFIMTAISSTVAETIYNIVDFGDNTKYALIALCSAMVSIVIWSLITWYFGIPTSQSHTLVATLSGAAIAIHHGISGISANEWKKVLYGLIIATVLGFVLGYVTTKLIELIFRNADRRRTRPIFKVGLILGNAMQAFLNAAQDGQKFMAIFLMGVMISNGVTSSNTFEIPIWLMILCASIMTLGICIGGSRIIKNIGMKMAKMETYQGTAADIAGSACLLLSTLTGIPLSTTQNKATAIMGVGAAKRLSSVDWNIAKNMVLGWVITFPGSGLLGYLFTKIFMQIFA